MADRPHSYCPPSTPRSCRRPPDRTLHIAGHESNVSEVHRGARRPTATSLQLDASSDAHFNLHLSSITLGSVISASVSTHMTASGCVFPGAQTHGFRTIRRGPRASALGVQGQQKGPTIRRGPSNSVFIQQRSICLSTSSRRILRNQDLDQDVPRLL